MNERSLFITALDRTDPDERARFLEEACRGDAALKRRVEGLLQAHDDARSFLEQPPVELDQLEPDGTLDLHSAATGRSGAEPLVTEPANRDDGSLDFLVPTDRPGLIGLLGPYEITEVIGRGGMGIVLKGHDPRLNRVVAIKVLAPELASNATARRRFHREAQAAAAVVHDHVVTIHAVDEAVPLPYLVMEYVAGISLQERLDRTGPLELKEILRIGLQTASGLAAAHAQGIVHRDIKPANILLENGVERVKLTDFGLARAVDDVGMTQTGVVTGTPQYMSPEQAQGEHVDHRSDLFSLGCVLYAMCSGRPPFRADNAMAVIRRICEDTPRPIREVNPDIPDWLVAIIDKLLEKNPADRFPSAAEVADLLERHLAHLQQPALVPRPTAVLPVRGVSPRSGARSRRSRWAAAAAILVLLAGSLGLTEATGVTQVVPTILRIVTGEGTLIVEVDDPNVSVQIDGEELIIKGAGVHEVRVRPGQHKVQAVKDGKPVLQELVTIARGGKRVVKVDLEPASPSPAMNASIGKKQLPVSELVEKAVPSLTEVRPLKGHTRYVDGVEFFADGRRAVSVSYDMTLRTWDMESGGQLQRINTGHPLCAVAISPDSRVAAVGVNSERNPIVELYNLDSGQKLATLVGHTNRVVWLAFTPDGRRLVSSGFDAVVRVWDLEKHKEARSFKIQIPDSVSLSPDGRLLAARDAEDEKKVRLWNRETGESIRTLNTTAAGACLRTAFTADGKVLVTASTIGTLQLWETETGREIRLIDADTGTVVSIAFTPDGRHLVVGALDGTLRVWNVAAGREVARAEARTRRFNKLAMSPDGRHVITGGGFAWDSALRRVLTDGDYDLHVYRLPEQRSPAPPPLKPRK